MTLAAPRSRAWVLVAAGLVGCNAAAAVGIALVDVSRKEPGSGFTAAVVRFFQPADPKIADPTFPYSFPTRAWVHWDSSWYASIAKDGYWYVPGEQSPVAFFPAYPMLVRALAALGMNRFVAGVLLTTLLGSGGLLLFHRWAARLAGERTALRATALFVAYPFAFYLFGVMYSDALFLCAVVGAFLALEDDRPAVAVLLGAVATAARPIAPAVVVGLVARRIELRLAAGERVRATDLVPALAGVGLAAYMLFLWSRFGDPFVFAHAETAPGWGNLAGRTSFLKVPFLEMLRDHPTDSGTYVRIGHAAISISAISCAIPLWRRVSKGYAIYVATAIGIPLLSSKDFMGLGRYTMAAFPVFLMFALLLEPRPRLRRAVLAASVLGLLLLTIAFAADNFVA